MSYKHTAFTELPTVDVSALFSDSPAAKLETAQALDRAAREVGFLYVTGHGITPDRISRLQDRAREFFALPEQEKMRHYIGKSENHSGYVPMGEERFYGTQKADAKEAYDIGFEMSSPQRKTPMLGSNQWPALSGFRSDVQAYYRDAFALGQALFEGFALGLCLPADTFTQYLSEPPSQLRLIHYFQQANAPEDSPGIGAHTDYEFFTILLPTSPGLQVLNGAGEWIDVPVLDGAFVVNIGDMMEVASNGRYLATSHRVKKIQQERYSFPLFCNLDFDTVVEPVPELCREEPAKYDAIKCGEHLLAQTIQTFRYLQERVARGDMQLPQGAKALSSFGNPGLRDSSS